MRFRQIPRDNGFYPLFERQAATAVDTAVQLEKLMASLQRSLRCCRTDSWRY